MRTTMTLGSARRRVGPRSSLERALRDRWIRLLGHSEFGVHDQFFDVGGTSLAALQLQEWMRSEFGYDVEFDALLRACTISGLGLLLRGDASGGASTLVPIRAGGSRPPLYCFHPLGGSVAVYFTLARELGEEQPVFGLQAVGLRDDRPPHDSMADMVDAYVEEILRMQPAGRHQLLGYSLGGVIAIAAAQALALRTEAPLVVLIDTLTAYPEEDDEETGNRALASFAMNLDVDFEALRALPRADALARIRDEGARAGMFDPEFPLTRLRSIHETAIATLRAVAAYRPEPYRGEVVLIQGGKDERDGDEPAELGWAAYAPRLTTYSLGLNHAFALDERAARRMGPLLRAHLAH
jgi:thioesterase domain-containing protein/aryl carrier-like protein